MDSSTVSSVSINVRFSLPPVVDGEEGNIIEKRFDETNCESTRLGLPPGVEAVKPKGGEYKYSGMHDHGPLPLPKEGGEFAKLIGMVNEARKHSDDLLTKIINEQKANAENNDTKKNKRQKVESN